MLIKNQIAVISGVSSGLGLATAKHLLALGAQVMGIDLRLPKETLSALNFYQADVSDEVAITKIAAEICRQSAVPRIVINCAGIAPGELVLTKESVMSLESFQQVIQSNLIGSFNVLKTFADQMRDLQPLDDDERGVIINTASIAAFEGQVGQAAYSAAKAAVVGLTLPLAREFSCFGIRVNCIAPGLMQTPMLANLPEKVQIQLKTLLQFPKRFGQAEEFAKLAAHLIENSLINGEVIRLDGGVRLTAK